MKTIDKRSGSGLRLRSGLGVWIILLLGTSPAIVQAANRTVVMISLDGAKPEYFSRVGTPHIYNMGEHGWAAPLRPIFPSVTFPNHATLVTGCTAEQHGIVSNTFEDPQRGHFHMSTDASWMHCEPLWVSSRKAGVKTAIALWPMSWGVWNGIRANYYFPENPKGEKEALAIPDEARLDQIVTWLRLPEGERPRLILSWLGDIDHQAHSHGPDATEVREAVRKYDALIGKFLRQLHSTPAGKTTNVIIVSDHGMSTTKNYISLDFLSTQLAKAGVHPMGVTHSGPLANFYLARNPGKLVQAEKLLGRIGMESRTFATYAQDSLPSDWHYRSLRSGQIILMAREGHVFTRRGNGETLLFTPGSDAEKGNHGYPPDKPDMQAIFFAEGPDFPHHTSPVQFRTVDVAPLIRGLLQLPLLPSAP